MSIGPSNRPERRDALNRRSRPASCITALLGLAAFLIAPVSAQEEAPLDTVLAPEAIAELDRQLDAAAADSLTPNEELWETVQRYRGEGQARRSAERVEIGGSIVVREDEVIEGDAVAVGGEVVVYGTVEGDCVAIGGDVTLQDGARVEGDAVSVGGRVHDLGDAEVLGERVSVDIGFPIPFAAWGVQGEEIARRARWFKFGFWITVLAITLVFSLFLYALMGRRLDVASRRVENQPGHSFLIGLLGALASPFAFVIAFVLLCITIIGIPLALALPVLFLAVIAAGFAVASLTVGRRLAARGDGNELAPSRGPYRHILLGFAALAALWILSMFLKLANGPIAAFAMLFGVLGFFVLVTASILGFGALMTTRFGTSPVPAPAGGPLPPGSAPPPPPLPAGPEPPEEGRPSESPRD